MSETDHDNPTESCPEPNQNKLQEFLKELWDHHVNSRVKHSQSNRKLERVILTLKELLDHFNCWNAVVHYYNYERPHSSLKNGCMRIPYQAFLDKTRNVKCNKSE